MLNLNSNMIILKFFDRLDQDRETDLFKFQYDNT